ncbi:hypothetical protein L596_010792 [Steinernema carpocapsae]|uniref:Uncharacterized protein n=1 Tax=Steinernema carpocapsae TaxID=34508 RepID=A0A4U5PJN7_STECR|nr:hypothetical protein L596_010792 [Steinernema carpocapsae]
MKLSLRELLPFFVFILAALTGSSFGFRHFDIWNERFPQITNILSAIQGCRILEIEDDFPDLPIVQKTNTLWCPKQVPLVLKKTVVNLITSGNPTGICCHVDTRSTDFAYQLIQAMNAQEGNEQCQLSLDGDRPLLNIYHDWDNGYIRDFGKGHFTFQKDLTVRPL